MERPFSSIAPDELKCEYRINPIGIDAKNPRFSWITKCSSHNSFQTAYRLLIASSLQSLLEDKADVWDSGKVNSSESNQIRYSGIDLSSNKTYSWKVRIWNENDVASSWSKPTGFATGLFEQTDWQAKWISHIYFDRQKSPIGFHEGSDKWIWYPFNHSDDKLKTIYLFKSFQIEHLADIESAMLLVTADEKFQLYLNEELIAKSDDEIFSWARPVLVNVKKYMKNGLNSLKVIGSNSYIEKPAFILKLKISFVNGESILIVSDESWKAALESFANEVINARVVAVVGQKPWRLPKAYLRFNPAAYFRKKFRSNKKISRAFVYASALGLYDLRINGKAVSDELLKPAWSDFNNRVYYNCYEITNILKSESENVINVILADGYYSGYCGWERGREYYGKFPAVKLQLMIDNGDCSREIIVTDESWTSSEGPIREADILMGEEYDSKFETLIEDWDSIQTNFNFKNVNVRTDVNSQLIAYCAEPVKVRSELAPQSIWEIGDKKFIIDFNQNFAGFVKLRLQKVGKRKITLRFAEMLNDEGLLYTENLRMARAHDTYNSRGDDEEIWQPMFTYHGFRYVEITGLDEIAEGTVVGVSINSLEEQTANFNSSNEKLNKLFNCILWNQRSNYINIPTDCPQRDERFGWLGDAVSFFNIAAHNFNVSTFYMKWLEQVFNNQREDGSLPPFVPFVDMGVGPVFFNSAGWADAGVITPFLFYEFYNDKILLREFYDRMKKFIYSLEVQSEEYILPNYGYGDWLYQGSETSKSLIATAYFAYDCSLMIRIANTLGYTKDVMYYTKLFKTIKRSFRKTFIDMSGSIINPTQTSSVLSLHFDLLENDERKKTIFFLTQNIIENNYHVTTGFLGLSFLMPVLSSIGRNDLAWRILTNEDFPSWFYMIDHGATTLWERWDSYSPHKGFFDPTMNSFNHCSLGCVGDWLFKGIAGINALEPGFRKFMIKPFSPEGLNTVKATIKTVSGSIKVEWERRENVFLLNVKVPFNTQAIFVIPSSEYEVNKKPIKVKLSEDTVYLEVGSGAYQIRYILN